MGCLALLFTLAGVLLLFVQPLIGSLLLLVAFASWAARRAVPQEESYNPRPTSLRPRPNESSQVAQSTTKKREIRKDRKDVAGPGSNLSSTLSSPAHGLTLPLSPLSPGSDLEANRRIAAMVDVETTGLFADRDEIVEISIQLFSYEPDSGRIIGTVESYTGLQEPERAIPAAATAIHGITNEMVRGKRLDMERLESLIDRAEYLIAHNATFDRRFLSTLLPAAARKTWLCTLHQIDWIGEGCPDRKLATLLQHFRLNPSQAHRAHLDTEACLQLLALRDRHGSTFLTQLLRAKPTSIKTDSSAAQYRPAEEVAQELADLLKDILQDGRVTQGEARMLHQKLQEYRPLCRVWPVDILYHRLWRIISDDRIDTSELDDLRELLLQIAYPGAEDIFSGTQHTVIPYTRPLPELRFHNRGYLMLGKFAFGTKALCKRALEDRGAVWKGAVSGKVDVIVIGSRTSAEDIVSVLDKVSKAMDQIRQGAHIVIVTEEYWTKFVLDRVDQANTADNAC
jgi:DNA polymerase III subunit epsilon